MICHVRGGSWACRTLPFKVALLAANADFTPRGGERIFIGNDVCALEKHLYTWLCPMEINGDGALPPADIMRDIRFPNGNAPLRWILVEIRFHLKWCICTRNNCVHCYFQWIYMTSVGNPFLLEVNWKLCIFITKVMHFILFSSRNERISSECSLMN